MNEQNDQRADLAFDAVFATTDLKQDLDSLPSYVGDLLANLMHLCNREKVDFNRCLQDAQWNFNEEKDKCTHST